KNLQILTIILSSSARRLSEYVSHYEPLHYDSAPVHSDHQRVRRSADFESESSRLRLRFKAHGHDFRLRLRRDLSAFSDRLEVHGPEGPIHGVDTSHVYEGDLQGDPGSAVFGSVIDGVFEGKIISKSKGTFYVEKSRHYFPGENNASFHSVIYNEKDVADPYESLREGHVPGCGINDDVLQWMEQVQASGVDDPPPIPVIHPSNKYKFLNNNTQSNEILKKVLSQRDVNTETHNKYSREANEGHSRHKRASRHKEDNKNTCSLFIQTDPLIWRHIREGFAEHKDYSKKAEVDEKTREEILSLIAHHVTAVNYIYRDTKFDGRIEHRNIKFEVQRIKIDDDSACGYPFAGEPNQFCMENIDVSNFLNLHSLGNHEDFCLAYVFTYRDFTGGTLGLAWVASASGASGGICEKYKTYTETVGGMYQSTKRSLNTGIITFVNYNSRVPPKVSQLTLAHEIGHNFGSPHDYPPECRPGGANGNYIMFASATSGDRPNNSKFSTCSVGNISNVLDAIEDNKKRNCFKASAGAFCGNKIVEAGEECDCGYDDEECTDKCCYPRVVSDIDRLKNSTASGCNRRANTQCSPSQGPCCLSDTCRFVPASFRTKCKSESDCSWSSTCNGLSPECPAPKPMANKTRCNNGTQLCINGECSGSICLEWNLTECFLTSSIIPNIDKRKLCELACQNGTDPATCRSTSEFAHQVGLPPGGISLRPGSPCDNFQGYCDVFLKCRAVDAEGPLVRLKNMLFNKQVLLTLAQWVTEYWYFVVLMGLAFIIVMGVFIKCCAVHTPSSNPKKPPARRISETLRRPMNTLRRMRHQQGGGGPRSVPVSGQSGDRSRPGGRGRSRSRGESSGGSRSHQHSRGAPTRGYSEGRPQYHPKASSSHHGHGRSSHSEPYAGAYGDQRNAYEMRQHKV
ncbi:disintegrin and metalloproteinase domain-containing protein 10-like, partial [Ctenocephalides felis]|uniref:disintegrin and metalloproteinase domain-containing protein 10-like n=1 Tax=Ctenocephalides felis TaxID=7515 RepID=UPI000E6E389E